MHCFTDTPDFAERLLDHFPNLFIGVTGQIKSQMNVEKFGMPLLTVVMLRCDNLFDKFKHGGNCSPVSAVKTGAE